MFFKRVRSTVFNKSESPLYLIITFGLAMNIVASSQYFSQKQARVGSKFELRSFSRSYLKGSSTKFTQFNLFLMFATLLKGDSFSRKVSVEMFLVAGLLYYAMMASHEKVKTSLQDFNRHNMHLIVPFLNMALYIMRVIENGERIPTILSIKNGEVNVRYDRLMKHMLPILFYGLITKCFAKDGVYSVPNRNGTPKPIIDWNRSAKKTAGIFAGATGAVLVLDTMMVGVDMMLNAFSGLEFSISEIPSFSYVPS